MGADREGGGEGGAHGVQPRRTHRQPDDHADQRRRPRPSASQSTTRPAPPDVVRRPRGGGPEPVGHRWAGRRRGTGSRRSSRSAASAVATPLLGVGDEQPLDQRPQRVGGDLALARGRQTGDRARAPPGRRRRGPGSAPAARPAPARAPCSRRCRSRPGTVVKRRSATGAATPKSPRRRWGGPVAGRLEQQVGRLHVAVHQAGAVDRGQPQEQLLDQQRGRCPRRAGRARAAGRRPSRPARAPWRARPGRPRRPSRAARRRAGWRTRTACSRTKRASSAELCRPSTLTATWQPVRSSCARHTDPMPPAPTWSSSR